MPLVTTISSPATAASTASWMFVAAGGPVGVGRRRVGAVHVHVKDGGQGAAHASQEQKGSETTDFADDTDNESIPFVRLCTDRFGEFRGEVPLHPCHPCHPWLSVAVFRFHIGLHAVDSFAYWLNR